VSLRKLILELQEALCYHEKAGRSDPEVFFAIDVTEGCAQKRVATGEYVGMEDLAGAVRVLCDGVLDEQTMPSGNHDFATYNGFRGVKRRKL
jgi:hypothetical protein